MRLSTAYAISALVHVAVLGVACYLAPAVIGPVLLPVGGGGGGLGIEFMPPGIPGGGSETTIHLELTPAEPALAGVAESEATDSDVPLASEFEVLETSVETSAVATRTAVPAPTPMEAAPQTFDGPMSSATAVTNQPQRVTTSNAVPVATGAPTAALRGRTVSRQAPTAGTTALLASAAGTGEGAAGGGPGKGGGAGSGVGSARGSGSGGGGGSAGGLVDSYPQKGPANLPPNYPLDALLASVEGRVILRVHVTSEGLVEDLAVERSANWPSLDEAALTAVRRWRFLPARRGGVAVDFEVLVPVRFSIRNQ